MSKLTKIRDPPNGFHLYREPNRSGGYTHHTDENSTVTLVWNTCTVDQSTLLAAIVEEYHRQVRESREIGRNYND